MEKSVIYKMRQIVKNEGESIKKDFKEDQKDLRQYKGDFLWGVSNQGTNLIFNRSPFSYLQIEDMKKAKSCYVCIAGHLKKVSKQKALSLANGLYTHNRCA